MDSVLSGELIERLLPLDRLDSYPRFLFDAVSFSLHFSFLLNGSLCSRYSFILSYLPIQDSGDIIILTLTTSLLSQELNPHQQRKWLEGCVDYQPSKLPHSI